MSAFPTIKKYLCIYKGKNFLQSATIIWTYKNNAISKCEHGHKEKI